MTRRLIVFKEKDMYLVSQEFNGDKSETAMLHANTGIKADWPEVVKLFDGADTQKKFREAVRKAEELFGYEPLPLESEAEMPAAQVVWVMSHGNLILTARYGEPMVKCLADVAEQFGFKTRYASSESRPAVFGVSSWTAARGGAFVEICVIEQNDDFVQSGGGENMKMKESEWLTASADLMYRIGEKRCLQDAWYDFLLWAACQSGVRTEFTRARQEKILAAYPETLHEKFYHLYRIIAYVVREKPRQNVPLRIMQAIHLAKRYTYNEQGARQLILEEDQDPDDDTYRISFRDQNDQRTREDFIWSAEYFGVDWKQEFENKIDNYLTFWNMGTVSFYDRSCAISGGSRLIAAANVFQENCPQEYRDRLFLIADDPHNRTFALMSFLQTALMGMACYVLTDDSFRVEMSGRLELFAPPTAICSLPCFSTAWNDIRKQVLAAKDTDLPI